jgi:transposase
VRLIPPPPLPQPPLPKVHKVWVPPAPKSLRGNSGRPSGGQAGHPGHRLEFREDPDHIVIHRPTVCRGCGGSLPEATADQAVERRQVFELQAREEVSEHQVHAVRCACCGEVPRAPFPAGVAAPTQYGPGMKTFVAYCGNYQLLPTARIQELIYDLTGHVLSEGTLCNLNTNLSAGLEPFVIRTRALLTAADVAHFDESGVRVQGKLQWVHSASTADLTYYTVQEKRGQEAMDAAGILPAFTGVAIQDAWAPYWHYACAHGLCNVHHQRELQAVLELDGQRWAGTMGELLYTAQQAVRAAVAAGQNHLPAEQLAAFTARYDDLIAQGLAANPLPDVPPVPRRGRPKQSKARNLVERLQAHSQAVLRFLHDFRVPFSNNQGEQDIRMVKVQQKISGTFRSKNAAEECFRIRGYISTVKKQGLPVLDFDSSPRACPAGLEPQ